MGTRRVGLEDVESGNAASRWRLLAPLRYLVIENSEKARYDWKVPLVVGLAVWVFYSVLDPKPPLFGDSGLLRFSRDMLIMAVPFMVGALAAVAMGAPGPYLDRRPVGVELFLNGKLLTLRQFVCYLLGYLCFLGLVTLILVINAEWLHGSLKAWSHASGSVLDLLRPLATLFFFLLLSALTVTVFWSLYFLTDVVNRPGAQD